ncbi:MAG: DMT family transporter [Candidatus Limiplasma sp.]|nr:DMT family transporter [Candidatus Limiplasma sp.]
MSQAKNFFAKRDNVALVALIAMILWGSAFPFVQVCTEGFQVAADDIPSRLFLAGIRFFSAGLILTAMCVFTGKSMQIPRGCAVKVILIGLLTTTFQYACNYIGLAYTTGGRASIWGQTGTFVLVLTACLFDRSDKLTTKKVVGSLLGFAGIAITNLGDGGQFFHWNGDGVLLLGAFGSTAGALISKRVLKQMNSLVLAAWQMCIGGGTLLAMGLMGGGELTVFTWQGGFSLGFLILISCVAYTLWMKLTQNCPLSNIAAYRFVIPLSGMVLSCLLTGEAIFTLPNMLSLALVITGVLMVNR